jgi:GNAT superfamily N-acetyltransferase
VQIVPFAEAHVEDAAALVARRYANLRRVVPSLPARYEQPAEFQALVKNITGRNAGVAALDGGQLIGFAAGMILSQFRGKRSVYCPEWGNAAVEDRSREVYQRLYTVLSDAWVADRCIAHYVSVFAHDTAGIEAWFWQGFGLISVDAMRGMNPAEGEPAQGSFETAVATPDDVAPLLRLETSLRNYIQAAPIFLVDDDVQDPTAWEEYLQGENNRAWLASCDGEPVAYLKMGPPNPDACYVIRDPKTVSITGAFTEEAYRAQGVATVLLNRALAWARETGHERCAVDFEPMNVLGARFWLRHFQPFCYSLNRVIDDRLAPPAG